MRAPILLLAAAVVAAAIGAAAGFGTTRAATAWDYTADTYNACTYDAYVEVDNDGLFGNGSQSDGSSACANLIFHSGFYWYVPCGCFWNDSDGWDADGYAWVVAPFTPSSNGYGYTQIRKPSTSYSPTIEAHATI